MTLEKLHSRDSEKTPERVFEDMLARRNEMLARMPEGQRKHLLEMAAKLEQVRAREEFLQRSHDYHFGTEGDRKARKLVKAKATEFVTAAAGAALITAGLSDKPSEKRAKQTEAKVIKAEKPKAHAPKGTTVAYPGHVKGSTASTPRASSAPAPVEEVSEAPAVTPPTSREFSREDISKLTPSGLKKSAVSAPEFTPDTTALGNMPEVSLGEVAEAPASRPERVRDTISPRDVSVRPIDIAEERKAPDTLTAPALTFQVPDADTVETVPAATRTFDTIARRDLAPASELAVETPHPEVSSLSIDDLRMPRSAEDISRLEPRGVKALSNDAPAISPSVRDLPPLPNVVADSAVETPAAPRVYPPGTAPVGEDEIETDMKFDFNAIGTKAAPVAPKPAEEAVPAKKPASEKKAEKRSGKIRVENLDERGNVFDPNTIQKQAPQPPADTMRAPVERESSFVPAPSVEQGRSFISDTIYQRYHTEIGDTSGRPALSVEIEPGAEMLMQPHGDTIERVRLPDGTYMAKFHSANEGRLDSMQEERMPDLQKVQIEGGFTVPEILKYRIHDTAWKKLQSCGLDAQRRYLERVESKENIGPWAMAVKSQGIYLLFDENNKLVASVPSLFGESKGDTLNTYTTSGNAEGKTTPAGKYILKKGVAHGEFGHGRDAWAMIFVNPDGTLLNQGLALHGETSADVAGQEKAVHSAEGEDNHKTIGCIRVDENAMNELNKYFAGQDHVTQYILSEDENMSYDERTGKFELLTPAEIRAKIGEGIKKFWQDNPITYYMTKVQVREAGRGTAKDMIFTRDPKANQKIVSEVKDRQVVEVPVFRP